MRINLQNMHNLVHIADQLASAVEDYVWLSKKSSSSFTASSKLFLVWLAYFLNYQKFLSALSLMDI